MIAFQDFIPQQLQPPGFLTAAKYEPLESAVKTANQWIHQYGVKVLNVETVVLPNMNNPGEEGTGDAQVRVSGDMASYWYQFVRVWYTQE